MQGENEKLLHMEDYLGKRVIGQKEAIAAVSDAVRRSRCRHLRPEPSDRIVPVPRPHRCGQDRTGQGARRLPVRRREGHGPHRHVRIHGEGFSLAPDRCGSGLRGLRAGRPADRGRAPPPVFRGAVRRGREGQSGDLRRAAGARRWPPDRWPGQDRGLQEHDPDHDLPTSARSSS